jgi:hypothetical protein
MVSRMAVRTVEQTSGPRFHRCGHGHGPHFFEVIEIPRFGAEDVHDNVAQIDENPIAGITPLDAQDVVPGFLQGIDQAVGKRDDLTVRLTAANDHTICKGCFSDKVDIDHVVCLAVFQNARDERDEVQDMLPGG